MTTVSRSPFSEIENTLNSVALARKRKDAVADEAVVIAGNRLKDALKALSDRIGNNATLRSKVCNSLYWKYSEIPDLWIREIFCCRGYVKPITAKKRCARCGHVFSITLFTRSAQKWLQAELKRSAKRNRTSPMALCENCTEKLKGMSPL